jgi:hypothetical protein
VVKWGEGMDDGDVWLIVGEERGRRIRYVGFCDGG